MSAEPDGTFRCATAARRRDDPVLATAPPARRLLLVEVPGPWGRTALTDSRLDRYAAGRLAEHADMAGVRVLLIRRPGRHAIVPGETTPRAWALVDTTAGRHGVQWGSWHDEHDLLEIDLRAPVPRAPEPSGPVQGAPAVDAPGLALVCTHGRHDVCCALRGRPVAAALAASCPDWDVWECSHLGGDRFAANLLLLPLGELFGSLDAAAAVKVVEAAEDGRLVLQHYRGRLGRPPVEQAAVHLAMQALNEERRGAVQVVRTERYHEAVHAAAAMARGVDPAGDGWTVDVQDAAGGRHRLTVASVVSEPHQLTCAAAGPAQVRRFELLSMDAVPA